MGRCWANVFRKGRRIVPATVPMVSFVAIAGAAVVLLDGAGAAAGDDESLPLQPATAIPAATSRAAAPARRGVAGRFRSGGKGGKPRSFPVGFGGVVVALGGGAPDLTTTTGRADRVHLAPTGHATSVFVRVWD